MSDIGGLAPKMRRIAESGHARADELRELADALDRARDAHYGGTVDGELTARSLLGAWARARRLYCEITGEPLV